MPVALGAIVPDLPGMLLWLVLRVALGQPDAAVWSTYEATWFQTLIAPLHAIPVGAALWLAARWRRSEITASFALSLVAHSLLDLPFHGRDAHRHFYPLSNWVFVSPVSYWDLGRHAAQVAVFELGSVALASIALWRRFPTRRARGLLVGIDAWLVLFYATGWAFWGTSAIGSR